MWKEPSEDDLRSQEVPCLNVFVPFSSSTFVLTRYSVKMPKIKSNFEHLVAQLATTLSRLFNTDLPGADSPLPDALPADFIPAGQIDSNIPPEKIEWDSFPVPGGSPRWTKSRL